MNILSTIRRLAGRRGGKKQSGHDNDNLVLQRRYNFATPAGLLASLDDADRRALKSHFNATIAAAVPFNNVRRLPDGHLVPCEINHPEVILSNTNSAGQTPELQKVIAKNKLESIGLSEEVVPTAERFLTDFVDKGMAGKSFPEFRENK